MGAMMIKHYTDHAANERTFLAWIRTGITITVFGFVIEKSNFSSRTCRAPR
jgi:putative membrane protein